MNPKVTMKVVILKAVILMMETMYTCSEPQDDRKQSLKSEKKSSSYQTTLRRARDSRLDGCTVPIPLVHEPLTPRDSRAILFMYEWEGKWCTIGYVVLEEEHAAMDRDSIILLNLRG